MTIDKEYPIGSIVINKKSKKRYKIINRIDTLHVPFHYFELATAEKFAGMIFQRDYFTLKDKFILEETVKTANEKDLEQVCKNCDQVETPKPVIHCPKYICSIDGREVSPYDCCALWGNEIKQGGYLKC